MILINNILELLYFYFFLLIGKNLKNKKIFFLICMCLNYFVLYKIIKFNIWFYILFFTLTYFILKLLYKKQNYITDIFLLGFASANLIIGNIIFYYLEIIINFKFIHIIGKIIFLIYIFFDRKNIQERYIEYCLLWNKHSNKKRVTSLTLRNLSVIGLNLMFFVLNFNKSQSWFWFFDKENGE